MSGPEDRRECESFSTLGFAGYLAVDFPFSALCVVELVVPRPIKCMDPAFIAFIVANPVVYAYNA